MKRISTLLLVTALAVLVGAVPALAAKQSLNEAELDGLTAAGQPEVLIAVGTAAFGNPSTFTSGGAITLTQSVGFHLTPAGSSQTNLRAISLNNVVGENLLANLFNIQGDSTGAPGGQTNIVEQSWGSTVDTGSLGGSAGTISISGKCIICTNTAGSGGGGQITIGGKAIATTDTTGSGGGKTTSIFGDEILIGGPITKLINNEFDLAIASSSQLNVNALVVNNIVGLNLAANGFNIASGAVRLGSDAFVAGAAIAGGVTQTNTFNQFRGTPFKKP